MGGIGPAPKTEPEISSCTLTLLSSQSPSVFTSCYVLCSLVVCSPKVLVELGHDCVMLGTVCVGLDLEFDLLLQSQLLQLR